MEVTDFIDEIKRSGKGQSLVKPESNEIRRMRSATRPSRRRTLKAAYASPPKMEREDE